MIGIYRLTSWQGLSGHSELTAWLVRDYDDCISDVDAHVRSGDYFSALATQLDALTEKLPPNSDEIMQIERLVRDLLYVDSKYNIISKQVHTGYEH